MAKIDIVAGDQVVDNSYGMSRSIIDSIVWIDPETGEYGYKSGDETKTGQVNSGQLSRRSRDVRTF